MLLLTIRGASVLLASWGWFGWEHPHSRVLNQLVSFFCTCVCLTACDCSGELGNSFEISHVCSGTACLCCRAGRKDGRGAYGLSLLDDSFSLLLVLLYTSSFNFSLKKCITLFSLHRLLPSFP